MNKVLEGPERRDPKGERKMPSSEQEVPLECMESSRGWTEGYRPYGRFQRVDDLESREENFRF